MTTPPDRRALAGIRREPPAFRVVAVAGTDLRSEHMVRVRLAGAALDGFEVTEPAASVRLLLTQPGSSELVLPRWNGNEFLLDEGERPIIRTFTPLPVDGDRLALDLDIVLHDGGAASAWVRSVAPGAPAAVSGPGRGYAIDQHAAAFLLAGDETAIPAIGQLIEHLPAGATVTALIEGRPNAEVPLPPHPGLAAEWLRWRPNDGPGAALVPAIRRAEIPAGCRVWVAGEAAAMHRIRRHLFEERGFSRRQATVRGYWKHGR